MNNVFTITNQGPHPVGLWLTDESDAVTFNVNGRSIETKENAITLVPTKTKSVSIVVDTRHVKKNQNLLKSVSFHASTDVSGLGAPQDGGGNANQLPQENPRNDQSELSNPPSNEKTKNNGTDGWTWTDNPVVNGGEAVLDAGRTALSISSDFFSGIKNWSRKKLLEKFSYITGQPKDALKSLGETGWNTLMGFAIGEVGMPGSGFQAKEASSPFYLVGSMLSVFNPITDSIAGIRDLAANLAKGDALGAAIETLGFLPGGGLAGDAGDLIDIPRTWVKSFPDKAATALKPLSEMILQPISTNSKRAKSFVQEIRGFFPNAAKRSDDGGSAASNGKTLPPGEKKKALPPGIQDLTKRDDIVGYTSQRMARLRNSKGFTNTDLNRFADKEVDLRMVEKLSNSGVSNAKIRGLTKTDADIEVAARLSRQGFTGDRLIYIAKHGDDAHPKLTLEEAAELKDAGYTAENIVYISKTAKKKYPVRVRGVRKPGSGATKEQLLKLREQEIPAEDVRHYVENSYSLKLVSYLRKQGHSSGKIRTFLVGSPEKIKKQIKRMGKIRDKVQQRLPL